MGDICKVIMIRLRNLLAVVVLVMVVYSRAQSGTCGGAGSSCMDSSFTNLCTCPAGTSCAPGSGGFFCQYTFCLPDTMMCGGNIGTCCSGQCNNQPGAVVPTCTAATTTTTTPGTASTTTTGIVIDIGTSTTSTSSCSTTG